MRVTSSDEHEADLSDELVIEVDGGDVHIDTLDAPSVLYLVAAYLDLLARCAAVDGEKINFYGLRAFEKCGALGTRPSDPEATWRAVIEATRILASSESPRRGLNNAAARVRKARRNLPIHYRASVKFRGIEHAILPEPNPAAPQRPYAVTSLRAYIQQIGGSRPQVTLFSKSEDNFFSLKLENLKDAFELGKYLYRPVDIVALVVRDRHGHIEDGLLRTFQPVLEGDADRAWSEWFKEAGVRSIDDLDEKKGGRGD